MDQKGELFRGLAKTLNAGGTALVSVFDTVAKAVTKVLPGEKEGLKSKVREYQKKIEKQYYEIGKEVLKQTDMAKASEAGEAGVKLALEYEREINKIQKRINEIEEEEKALKAKHEAERVKKREAEKKLLSSIKSEISKAINTGKFEAVHKRTSFGRVAEGLLSGDPGLRIFSVIELGRIRNKAAVPILYECVKFGDPNLTCEIIKALISIADPAAVKLCKQKITSSDIRVKHACLVGLYELSFPNSISLIIDALQDRNPEIRITAATLLGWKEAPEAIPALTKALANKDARLKKAVITSLKNMAAAAPVISALSDRNRGVREAALDALRTIMDSDIQFDIDASGSALSEEIEKLKKWWDAKRKASPEISEPPEDKPVKLKIRVLKKMLKDDLLEICKKWGIKANKNMTKTTIIKLIKTKDKQ